MEREYRQQYERQCERCAADFTTWNKAAKYCAIDCRTKSATERRDRTSRGDWLRIPVTCGKCGVSFLRTKQTGPNKKYCSDDCSLGARRDDQLKFKLDNPAAMSAYNRRRTRGLGTGDTVMVRLRKRYPGLPTVCEAMGCTETRVLEIAHKPDHKRNGAWRTMAVMERHMFWLLCPTCHRVLDREIETPEQMGLG